MESLNSVGMLGLATLPSFCARWHGGGREQTIATEEGGRGGDGRGGGGLLIPKVGLNCCNFFLVMQFICKTGLY